MITEKDLQEAIAECQGQRNPNASTCIKLAAFYIILDHLYGQAGEEPDIRHSYRAESPETAETAITYDSGTEFSEAIYGRSEAEVWPIMDELMETIRAINPRLYAGVMRQLNM